MLKTRIIPCLDVKDGRVVKGVNFVELVDAGDPVEQAKLYDAQGADELCFLDITASSDNRSILYDGIIRVSEQCFMPLTVGGGVRTVADIRNLLLAGADKVSINTEAVKRPEIVGEGAEKFGSQCIVVAIKQGINLELTRAVSEAVTIPVIASGGIGTLEHFCEAVKLGKADAVLAASVFHFGTYTIAQVKAAMQKGNIPVRL